MTQEWLENYKEHLNEVWASEYPEEGEPYANLDEIILEQLRNMNKGALNPQVTSGQIEESDWDELDERVMNALANEHFAAKPY